MSKIEINSFSGIRPVISADKLAGNEAQTANNCKFRSGSLEVLTSGDIPSKTVNAFSFTDGFGTWTLAGTAFKLNGSAVNLSAPSAPVVTATSAFTQSSITTTSFTVSATAPSGSPTGLTSATAIGQQSSFLLNGTRLAVTYTVQPVFIGITTTAIANAFSTFTRSASLTINSQAFTTNGQEVNLAGGVGRIRLENIDYSSATITWKRDESGVYRAYASEWTVTFEFEISYTTDMAIERAVVYRLTTVETNGMEGPASNATSLVSLMPNNYAVISSLATGKTKRLYRAAGTELDAKYYLVAEIASGTTTYTDLVADADLGEVMPETENPPTAMTQVVWLPGGFCAGFYGKDIYFCEPFKLYSWPSKYTLTTQKTIVGLAVTGNDLYVLSTPPSSPDTDANNYIITGVAPEVMTMSELAVNEGCSAIGSICKVGTTIGFASPTGYILITGGRGKNITEPFYNKTQWAALTPASMVAKESDSQIFIYNATSAGIIIDYLNSTVRTFSSLTPTQFTWRSKVFESDLPIEMHVAQLEGASGSHTLTLYADGAASPVFTGTITAGTDLVITRGLAAASRWEMQVVGSTRIDNMKIIHRERVIVDGPMRITKSNVEGSWRRLMFQFPNSGRFKVVRARASAYNVTAEFFRDTTSDSSNTITNDSEVRLTQQTDNDFWEVDITASGEVYELMLVPRVVRKVDGPIVMRNLQHFRGHLFHFPNSGSFKVGRVRGADGGASGNLVFYVDEAASATLTQAVTTDADFRITGINSAELVEVEFVPTNQEIQIDEIMLIPRTIHTVTGPVVLRTENRLSWKGNVFWFPRSGWFKVARARGAPSATLGTLNLRSNESDTVTLATALSNDTDLRLTAQTANDLWEVEVTGNGNLDELVLWPQSEQETNSPVIHVSRSASQGPTTWLAQSFRYPEQVRIRTAIVKSRTYPVTLTIYCDETQVGGSPYTVTNANEFRLNVPTSVGRVWEFDAAVSGVIDSVTLFAETVAEADMVAFVMKYDGTKGDVSTLARVVRLRRDDCFACARVQASTYPVTLKLYRDYGNTPIHTAQVLDGSGFWLPKMQPARTWEVDAIPSNSTTIIHTVALAKSMAALRA